MAAFDQRATMYEGSEMSLRSELSSMKLPATDVSCLYSADYMKVFPLQALTDSFAPLEFVITSDSASFIDLSNSYLHLVCRLKKANGTSIPTDDTVAPASHFFSQMFKNLEVFVNDKLVSDSSNLYPYVGYMHRLLTTPQTLKDTKLKNEFWIPDATPDSYADSTNAGYVKRKTRAAVSKPFSMLGVPASGIFTQEKWFPPMTTIRLVLRRSSPEFCLNRPTLTHGDPPADINYKIEIDEAVFLVARKPINYKIMERLHRMYDNGETYKYILNDAQVKVFNIPSGLSSCTSEAILLGKVPKQIIIGLVKSAAINGDLRYSPMNFQPYHLKEVCVNWAADSIEQRIIPLSFSGTGTTAQDSFLLALSSLEKTAANPLLGNGLSVDNYKNGNVLVAVELLPSMSDALSVNRRAQVKLSLSFRQPTAEAITAIVYCLYQNILELGKHGVQIDT